MAEYLEKAVILDETGQNIQSELSGVNSNTGSIAQHSQNINSTLNTQGNAIKVAIERISAVQSETVKDVYQNEISTVDTNRIAHISAPTKTEYDSFTASINSTLADHDVRITEANETAESAAVSVVNIWNKINNLKYSELNNKPTLYSESTGNSLDITEVTSIEPFLKDSINFSNILKSTNLSDNTTITGLNTAINTNKTNIQTNKNAITSLTSTVGSNTGRITTLESNSSTMSQSINSLGTRVTNVESSVANKAEKFGLDNTLKYNNTVTPQALGVKIKENGGLAVDSSAASGGLYVNGFEVSRYAPGEPNLTGAIKVVILPKTDITPRQYGYLYIYLE